MSDDGTNTDATVDGSSSDAEQELPKPTYMPRLTPTCVLCVCVCVCESITTCRLTLKADVRKLLSPAKVLCSAGQYLAPRPKAVLPMSEMRKHYKQDVEALFTTHISQLHPTHRSQTRTGWLTWPPLSAQKCAGRGFRPLRHSGRPHASLRTCAKSTRTIPS